MKSILECKLEFKSDSLILQEIFSFYKNKFLNFDESTSKENIASRINMFIDDQTKSILTKGKSYTDSIIKDLEENSFCNTRAYTLHDTSDIDFFKCMMFCSGIKERIHENISPERKALNEEMEKYGKLERKVSPPLNAYKYVPFNKMDIKYSNKSYGLLFE